MKRDIIDFIGIGAEKAGTTWIADCLREHPEVYIPKKKELFFFNEYDPHFLKVKNYRYERGIDWYKNQFENNGLIKGEFSPTYLYDIKAAKRIKKHMPLVKIIIILRNPTERAYSQYIHDKRLGVIKNIPFEDVLEKYPNYIEKGRYAGFLRNYFDLFLKKNFLILLTDDVAENSENEIRKVYEFIGVKQKGFKPKSLNKKKNRASKARFSTVNYLMLQTEYLLRKNNLNFILSLFDDVGARKLALSLRDLNSKPVGKYPKINKETKDYLDSLYETEVLKLEKLIRRDLSKWKV